MAAGRARVTTGHTCTRPAHRRATTTAARRVQVAPDYSPNCQQVFVAPIKLSTPLSSAPAGYENANW